MRKTTTNSNNGTAISISYTDGRVTLGIKPEEGDDIKFDFGHPAQLRHFIGSMIDASNKMQDMMDHISKTIHVVKGEVE
jgi:hypothetical protein